MLKILGASTSDISRIYLVQVGAVAALATACGLVVGVGLPVALVSAVRDILPVQPAFALTPWPLVTSAAYGLLIAFIFIMQPLPHTRTLPAASLFRETVDRRRGPDRVRNVASACAGTTPVSPGLVPPPRPRPDEH